MEKLKSQKKRINLKYQLQHGRKPLIFGYIFKKHETAVDNPSMKICV